MGRGRGPYNGGMSDEAGIYLAKAEESLAGAESEFASGRYNNCANRAYYACFQAAVAALIGESIRPGGGGDEWDHRFVRSRFAGQLVNRRKLYPPRLRDTLSQTSDLREQGDYRPIHVGQRRAARSLSLARTFVSVVASRGGTRP